jgi:hypothetical protein
MRQKTAKASGRSADTIADIIWRAVDGALVVDPKRACEILGIGTTRLYELLDAQPPALASYLEGRGRRITTESIAAYYARRLSGATPPRQNPSKPPLRRRKPAPHRASAA